MGKNKKSLDAQIDEIDALSYGRECMKRYGTLTLQDRAVPDYRDGLKPSHRRVIWASYKLNAFSNKPTMKCARIVGDTIGKYHPHGDIPAYGSLVTMVTGFQEPLLHEQGNFGNKVTSDGPAHFRYTETRLTKFAEIYLLDPQYLEVTPMVPNYDGKNEEPVYLPAKLPLSLIHSIDGIATGASVNITSFSVSSVKKTVLKALKKGKVTHKDCYKLLEFNFREGGFVEKDKSMLDMFRTGHGSIQVYPEVHFDKKLNAAVMTSYTPRFKIEHMQKALTIKDVKDVENLTSKKTGIKIIFRFKKNLTNSEYENLTAKVQDKLSCSIPMNILVTNRHDNGEEVDFKYSTPHIIINEWVDWRIAFEKKVVERLVSIEQEKVQKIDWLLWAVQNKQLVYKGLETTEPEKFLVKKGKIEFEHAKYIYDQQIRRLGKIEEDKLKSSMKDKKKLIKNYKSEIKNTKTISERIIKQMS